MQTKIRVAHAVKPSRGLAKCASCGEWIRDAGEPVVRVFLAGTRNPFQMHERCAKQAMLEVADMI